MGAGSLTVIGFGGTDGESFHVWRSPEDDGIFPLWWLEMLQKVTKLQKVQLILKNV